ncbi:MAG: iron ABC transporter permease [Gammaproteobacteria bacterium]|nr:iron ABC transporter permease [Gammaproteobacteria bacterium]
MIGTGIRGIAGRITPKFGVLGWIVGWVVALAAIPSLFVLYSSAQLSWTEWLNLGSTRLPGLLWNTLLLAMLVAIGCFALGVSTAWLVARRKFAGRKLAIWLLVLPLAIPTYVFAHIYSSMLTEEGWLGLTWIFFFGHTIDIPDIYNAVGVAVILSLAGFSYVFLLVRAALLRSNRRLEEAARIHGASPLQTFRRINLPLLRPAIAAGLAVVVLHVLSDFGAVSMLRYQTFTLSIYSQMSGRFDYNAAAGLSLVLLALSLTFLALERFFRSKQRYYSSAQAQIVKAKPASQAELWLIWIWIGLVSLFAFVLPVTWMCVWSWEAWAADYITAEFWGYVFNSGVVSFTAATLAIILAFPIALYHARHPSISSHTFLHVANMGFALPGPVVALGVITFMLSVMPALYGGLAALIMAVVVRFLPLAIQAQEASMQQLTPSLEQAGRILGAGPFENLWRVTLPMVRGGLVSAWVLVFIDVLKELPATLLLRPVGFDTLPVRIWLEASEEMLELAAPAALILVIGTCPAIWVMMRSEKIK